MKKTLSFLFFSWFLITQAQQVTNIATSVTSAMKPEKINKYLNAQYNENYLSIKQILKDKNGKTYTYNDWKPLLESGDYAVKKENLGKSEFIIYKLTDNERVIYHKNVETPGYYKQTFYSDEGLATRTKYPSLDASSKVKTSDGSVLLYLQVKKNLNTGKYILKKDDEAGDKPVYLIVEMDAAQKSDFVKRMTKLKLRGMGSKLSNKLPNNVDLVKGDDGKIYDKLEGNKLMATGEYRLEKIKNPNIGEAEYSIRKMNADEMQKTAHLSKMIDTAFFAERIYITDEYLRISDENYNPKFTYPTQQSIVRSMYGNVYPYQSWRTLMATGKYGLKSLYTFENGLPEYEIYVKTDQEINSSASRMAKPKISDSFIEGEKFKGLKITDINGHKYDLRNVIDKVVVLNFWFINCSPCRAEMPQLNEIVNIYKGKEVVFLAICLDDASDINRFLKLQPFTYNIIDNGRNITDNYNVKSYPTHVVIDKNGIIKFSTVGLASNTIYWLKKSIEQSLN